MPSDVLMKSMNAVHRAVMKITGGRVGWHVAGMTVVELTTIGRKSGEPRTVILTSPLREGDALVVVASRGGDDSHPAWFLNLRDHPEVTVSTRGRPAVPMVARVATPEERARLWPRITADHRNYGEYQKKTERVIPLVLLESSDRNVPESTDVS